jgi:hypothetical protein
MSGNLICERTELHYLRFPHHAFSFLFERAPRAVVVYELILAVPAPRAGYFLVATRKYPKKRSPRWRAIPALRAFAVKLARRHFPVPRARCCFPAAPLRASAQRLAMLRRAIGGGNPNVPDVVLSPPEASRTPRADDVGPERASEGSRACASGAGRRRMRTPGGNREAEGTRAVLWRGRSLGGRWLWLLSPKRK